MVPPRKLGSFLIGFILYGRKFYFTERVIVAIPSDIVFFAPFINMFVAADPFMDNVCP